MTFQRNRYGSDLDLLEISEKDLADKVYNEVSLQIQLQKLDYKYYSANLFLLLL